jgi:choline kinase
MGVTKAIILAAGQGSRLRPLTDDRPKCLLEVGGRTLLARQIEALGRAGVSEFVAVLGYRGDQVRRAAGPDVRYIENAEYTHTNSLYSLWLAREELLSGAVVLNSDVLALPRLFAHLLFAPQPDAVLVEPGVHFVPEDMKVTIEGGCVVDFGKDLPYDRAHAHNVGVAKFSAAGAKLLVDCLNRLVVTGHANDWTTVAYREFARQRPLAAISTEGMPWIEIDFIDDLTRARAETGPAIAALDSVSAAG